MALEILQDVERRGAWANRLLATRLSRSGLRAEDKALATELVYGTLRWQGRADWYIEKLTGRPADSLSPWCRNILRMAIYEACFMKRTSGPVVVHQAVELANHYAHRGIASLVNAVLRRLVRNDCQVELPDGKQTCLRLSVEHSHPLWLVHKWCKQYGSEETRLLCAANNRPFPLTIRANRLKVTRDELAEMLAEHGVSARPTAYAREGLVLESAGNPSEVPGFSSGLFSVQGEAAMLASIVLDPKPGDLVLDLCSAPGGKSTHLAELMRDQGCIISVDQHEGKLALVRQAAERLGLTSIRTVAHDAAELRPGTESAGYGRLPRQVDAVMLDVPCSGLGVIGRRPDLRWRVDEEAIDEAVALQRRLLAAAALWLKPGGRLVYSTCTLTREENEDNIRWFLEEFPEYRLEDISVIGPLLDDRPLCTPYRLGEETGRGCLSLLPHQHGTDGYFIASLVREL